MHGLTSGDLDHDGFLDLVGQFNLDEKGLTIRRGRGDGNFFAPVSFHGSYHDADNHSSIHVRDQDGDTHLDAAAGGATAQEFSFWRGQGTGFVDRVRRYGVGGVTPDIAWGDFDGDGTSDALCLTEGLSLTNTWYYPALTLIRGSAPAVPGDLDGNRAVDFSDLLLLLASWGPCGAPCPADLDGDGEVAFGDLLQLLSHWS